MNICLVIFFCDFWIFLEYGMTNGLKSTKCSQPLSFSNGPKYFHISFAIIFHLSFHFNSLLSSFRKFEKMATSEGGGSSESEGHSGTDDTVVNRRSQTLLSNGKQNVHQYIDLSQIYFQTLDILVLEIIREYCTLHAS